MGSTSSKKKASEIVLFGDSLTQYSFDEGTRGFGWVLEQKYEGKAEVINEGVAGFTSSMLKDNFRLIVQRATLPHAPPTLLFTIFLGANDACLRGSREYVPLPEFEDNIRDFVGSVLIEDGLTDAKVVLITPPPINIPDPVEDMDLGPAHAAAAKNNRKTDLGYRTYMSKKKYAEKIMQIAGDYEETGRVIGLNLWKALVDAALNDQDRLEGESAYHEERLPGCGLADAKAFKQGYFTDGLHFDALAYDVLAKGLLEAILKKWPELAPEKLDA